MQIVPPTPARSTRQRDSRGGGSRFTMEGVIFVAMVAYALALFAGGLVAFVFNPQPGKILVTYSWIASLTFLGLGRCIYSGVSWGLPTAAVGSVINDMLLAIFTVAHWDAYASGDIHAFRSAITLSVMSGLSTFATVGLILLWVRRIRNPSSKRRQAGNDEDEE